VHQSLALDEFDYGVQPQVEPSWRQSSKSQQEGTAMQVVRGFPSTMMDDCQLSVINLMTHAARNFDKRQIDLRLDEAYRNLPPYAMGRFDEIGSCDKEIV
jgi:hypothetical protein